MAIVLDASRGEITPRPSKVFSARDIAELALQKIGAFSPNDESADPVELERALEHMELEIAELAGTERCQWLVPKTIVMDLLPDVSSYDLMDQLGTEAPSLSIAYVIEAMVRDSSGHETPIPLVRRMQFEEIANDSSKGTPSVIHVDRLKDRPTIFVWPTPADNDDDGEIDEKIVLVVQTYAPTVLGAESTELAGDVPHGFDRAWQKWLVNATALAIGDGPVRQLDSQKLARLKRETEASLAKLLAYQNREKVSMRLRRTAHWWP